MTIKAPNGVLHVVFIQDPDGFVVELLGVENPPADAPAGSVISGNTFEATLVERGQK